MSEINTTREKKLSQQRLQELISYDPNSGEFTWNENGRGRGKV